MTEEFSPTKMIGISLNHKTTNEGGQSSIDCGNLWQEFEKGGYYDKIPKKKSHAVHAVYYGYEGDHTQPFSYFIGCPVEDEAVAPEGMDTFMLHGGKFEKFVASGKIPGCIGDAWREIWQSKINRAYDADFEVYDERSKDWEDAEVDIYISVL